MWGLITLGEQTQVRQRGRVVIEGDHSIFLMIEGIIILLITLILIGIYIFNIRDAYRTGRQIEQGIAAKSIKQSLTDLWEKGFAYILISPAFLFIVFLSILPLLFGILIAFTNYSGPNYLPPKNLVDWVGFKSFIDLFSLKAWRGTFIGVFIWTVIWAVAATITTYFVGLFYAVIINHPKVKLKKMWRAIFILPMAVPQVITILIMRNIFNGQFGPINNYLVALGLDRIPWLTDPLIAKMTIVMINVWFGLPFWLILMTGVLTGIDKEMYEAADVDGATGFHKFWKLTFPLVLFATAPLLIMQFAFNFNNFNIIYLLTEGGPANSAYYNAGSTDILISWIYKLTLDISKFNMASVVSILIFLIIAPFSIWNFRRTKAFKEEDMIQ
ncbi:carbohydrate ABC transporter permease [Caldalkalibacillus mannanilyticus]|uniref:carbohydrate ABC transporter permease n=1 Tax=Caldalkalibacillus mannanilyticus TaxID=1418 RepID=UPI000A4888B6|nr:sugar ABC transporter permease [Caldalkalibacillus mannanilyticus]